MAQYDGKAIIPIDDVCRDYFLHLTPTKLVRKISRGDCPSARADRGESEMREGYHLNDLARYLDQRTDAARREMKSLTE